MAWLVVCYPFVDGGVGGGSIVDLVVVDLGTVEFDIVGRNTAVVVVVVVVVFATTRKDGPVLLVGQPRAPRSAFAPLPQAPVQ